MNASLIPVNSEAEKLVEAARDALTDDMVARLANTVGEAVELLDRVNRSGLDKAVPILAEMVDNGDLARLAQLARLLGSAEDAMTEDMVGRLTGAFGGGLELIDQVNRSGIENALPTISRMVAAGDLDRLTDMARLVASAQDAMTDDMVNRLAGTFGDALNLMDRLMRCGIDRLVGAVEQLEASGALGKLVDALPVLVSHAKNVERVLGCLDATIQEEKNSAPAAGGIGALWSIMRDPETVATLRFFMALGGRLRTACGQA
ncbi:MAG: hypothetical protein LBE62_16365 [Azonexus sp.]|jgi:uncharacterized protein YjgD (DUF1641 family)|nr:hypothetical protein [Azonexus sp.]